MTQLIINGITLPESSRDRYSCWEETLAQNVEMASGRMVREVRGTIYKIKWTYDYMGLSQQTALMTALQSSDALTVSFLVPGESVLQSGTFLMESKTNPTFAFSKDGTPYWHNVGFTLREVSPHDRND